MSELVLTDVIAGEGKPIPVWLARIGVSDTLYADRVGNLFGKQETTSQERDQGIPYDASGFGYRALEWNEGSPSAFYASNKRLIENAQSRAADAQKASPLELIQ